jgi:hypothetical protein
MKLANHDMRHLIQDAERNLTVEFCAVHRIRKAGSEPSCILKRLAFHKQPPKTRSSYAQFLSICRLDTRYSWSGPCFASFLDYRLLSTMPWLCEFSKLTTISSVSNSTHWTIILKSLNHQLASHLTVLRRTRQLGEISRNNAA